MAWKQLEVGGAAGHDGITIALRRRNGSFRLVIGFTKATARRAGVVAGRRYLVSLRKTSLHRALMRIEPAALGGALAQQRGSAGGLMLVVRPPEEVDPVRRAATACEIVTVPDGYSERFEVKAPAWLSRGL